MHDIVIRGGTIIDGTGRTAFTGDLAIEEGRIAAVGGKAGPAKRNIVADGLLVTPGWVDVHTHYDGQATWDPILAPSSWHGVTTILFGNCGVGFAPVRPYHRDALIDLMEGSRTSRARFSPKASNGIGRAFRIFSTRWKGCRGRSTSRRRFRTIRCASM
jgi:N-acyl-D-aspartate/D-glutamate deacylase